MSGQIDKLENLSVPQICTGRTTMPCSGQHTRQLPVLDSHPGFLYTGISLLQPIVLA